MPAKSKKQQMAAGAALSAKRGRRCVGSLRGASHSMYSSMNAGELRRMAKTKRKKLPARSRKTAKKKAKKKTKKSAHKKSAKRRRSH